MSTLEIEPAIPEVLHDSVASAKDTQEKLTVLQQTSGELSALQETLDRALRISHPNIKKIDFSNTTNEAMTARYEAGTLVLAGNDARIQALDQLSGLDALLSDVKDGQVFKFRNGSWAAAGTPIAMRAKNTV